MVDRIYVASDEDMQYLDYLVKAGRFECAFRSQAAGMEVSLVEDYQDLDWLIVETPAGTAYHAFENIEIGSQGYFQPARLQFDELYKIYGEI